VGKVAAAGTRIHELIAQRDGTDRDLDSARGYQRSWIETSRALDDGKYIRGYLNAEDAAVWDGLIAPLAKPAGPGDTRDTAERTAAALTTTLTQGTTGTRALVIIDLDTLTGGPTPARLPDGTPIPAEQARRLALNAGVKPCSSTATLTCGNVTSCKFVPDVPSCHASLPTCRRASRTCQWHKWHNSCIQGKPRPGERLLKPVRQLIESVNDTLKGQLDRPAGHPLADRLRPLGITRLARWCA
jgi:uncharacterized protein DUF222